MESFLHSYDIYPECASALTGFRFAHAETEFSIGKQIPLTPPFPLDPHGSEYTEEGSAISRMAMQGILQPDSGIQTTIKTTGVHITTIVFLRIVIIEMVSLSFSGG